jgi:hypothetical protein
MFTSGVAFWQGRLKLSEGFMGRLTGLLVLRAFLVALLALALVSATATSVRAQEKEAGATGGKTTLIKEGKSRFVIYAPTEVMGETDKEPASVWTLAADAKANRLRLRESVKDLSATLEKISGAKVEVIAGAPSAGDARKPILVGSLGEAKFGKPAKPFELKQGFRYVVTPEAIGLIGESDLATSYAVYELLYRLGCRMYMPGDLGWCVPSSQTVTLANADYSGHPYTEGRAVWYADNEYGRRNRIGGRTVNAGHALEMYLDKKDLEKHPEWRATVDGKPQDLRLKWSAPGLTDAIADKIIAQIEKNPKTLSYSLSPEDGLGYDNSKEDQALDAGDFDDSMQAISLTDRLVWVCNRIAKRVNAKYPDIKFGMAAYVPYSRPPVREKLDGHIIPQIAPITFSRAHPMNDDGEPNNKDLRMIVEGWAKASPKTAYYFYSWFLAELSGPNPMIKKWSNDIPYVYQKGNCVMWQPETITNFESSFHAYALGFSLAWDPTRDPKQIIDELNTKFYGHAAKEMSAYWSFIDEVWCGVPEYSGSGFGHMRRWSPAKMKQARVLMDAGKAAARTQLEKDRIALADESLKLFEEFMRMRGALADGQWANLAKDSDAYMARMLEMGEKYKANYAFGKVSWSGTGTINNAYFSATYLATNQDAARVANSTTVLLDKPIRNFKFIDDPKKVGDAGKWYEPGFNDKAWRQTDVSVDTWSAMNLHNYMGVGWYRTTVKVPKITASKKVMLWVGSTDGSAEVWVNGQKAKYVDPKGKKTEFTSYCEPASFDVTGLLKEGENQITIKSDRTMLNELGTGGLLAPVTLYQVPQ